MLLLNQGNEVDLTAIEQWFQDVFIPGAIDLGKSLLVSLIVFLIGRQLIKWICKLLNVSFQRSKLEDGPTHFLLSVARIILYIILSVFIAGILGLETSSIVALIGSAGLAIGLALQGSLSNFAGGVLILLVKPFKVGDYIITDNREGTVQRIDIFNTRLLTADNRLVILPNGTLSNSDIINVTNEPIRRLDTSIPISYSTDISEVRNILLRIATSCEYVLPENDIDIFISSLESSSMHVTFRIWVATDNYWPAKMEILEMIKTHFDDANIEIPHNKVDVKIVKSEKGQ